MPKVSYSLKLFAFLKKTTRIQNFIIIQILVREYKKKNYLSHLKALYFVSGIPRIKLLERF